MNTDTLTVYSKAKCPQCSATKRYLDKRGIGYRTVDITEDDEAREFVMGLGYTAAPVIVTGSGDHWAGFRPDRLKQATTAEERAA